MAKKSSPFRVRNWNSDDIPKIMECQSAAYADYEDPHYDERVFELQLAAFPEGQFLVEEVATGRVVGYACSIIVQIDDDLPWFTWSEITGDGTFKTHDPSGDTLYGADIAVHPDFRGQGIAGLLYRERKRILQRYNLRRMVAHGRIPGYRAVAGRMTPEEYINRVRAGELKDSALNAHIKAGYEVRRIFHDYVRDPSSLDFSTLLEMGNPRFKPDKRRIAVQPLRRPVRRVRICLAQFFMRRVNSWKEFEQNIDFFVDTADIYHCHFLVFPELFTAQLFSLVAPDKDDRDAMREVAAMTDQYVELFRDRASRYGLYIIGGSQPVLRDGILYNTAHLFTPGGNVYTQDKLHITPTERRTWDIQPGTEMQLFDTPLGRIGIQICYDVEFPELSRIMALAGAEVLFVPFSTDEKKSYFRVRISAQARAVENYMYVAIAGNVGNLPSVRSYLINYAESAILTPSDFSYPVGGIHALADPNVETVVIGDLDLSSLSQQRDLASVQPLMDRRIDMYDIKARVPLRIVRVD